MQFRVGFFQFRSVVAVEFVKNDSWPQLVPQLRAVIQDSDLINRNGSSEWKTINALTVLHSIIRPFQVLHYAHKFIGTIPIFPFSHISVQNVGIILSCIFMMFLFSYFLAF